MIQKYKKAKEWWEKAANQNNADAQYCLGTMYYCGEGLKQDYDKSREWLQKAANRNHTQALQLLALILDEK